MSDFTIQIDGIEETCAKLSQLPTRFVKDAFAKALTAACVPIVQTLIPHIPTKTGNLAAHLMTDIAIDAAGKGGEAQIGFGKAEGHIARLVEYGHAEIGHEPLKKEEKGPVQAHAFMRPAAESSAEEAINAFADSIRESVDEGLK